MTLPRREDILPRFMIPSMARRWFPGATDRDWLDWRWQARNAIKTLEELERCLPLSDGERAGVAGTRGRFRLGITPYYLSLVDPDHPFCPVRMQAVPVAEEARVRPGELRDPLGEDPVRPNPSIVHKYPDRVLLLAVDRCPVYCRHCTRRRLVGADEPEISRETVADGVAYIAAHPEVRDVLVSGGDPLQMSTARLEEILAAVRRIPHVEIVRIGTRAPVCNPMRVDDELAHMLRRYAPLFVVTHFNHPKEVTPLAAQAVERLVDHGVPVENQAVLLRCVNSSARIITELCHAMLKLRARPYYLHQCDLAEGLEHLRTPLEAGVEILRQMRGFTSGLAVPHLAVDLPGGGGKVTLQPEYVVERGEGSWTFRSYRGREYRYPQPEERDCSCPYDKVWTAGPRNRQRT